MICPQKLESTKKSLASRSLSITSPHQSPWLHKLLQHHLLLNDHQNSVESKKQIFRRRLMYASKFLNPNPYALPTQPFGNPAPNFLESCLCSNLFSSAFPRSNITRLSNLSLNLLPTALLHLIPSKEKPNSKEIQDTVLIENHNIKPELKKACNHSVFYRTTKTAESRQMVT